MNQPITNKSGNNRQAIIILATVFLTTIAVVAILFSFDFLGVGSSQANEPMIHTQGMVHTEGMVHSDELHAEMISDRQAEIAERSLKVMPFDLERTTHIFEKTEFGGVQQVLSDDGDLSQIELIQAHLAEEAERFQTGDFGDPALIHGHDMPGLAELEAGFEHLEVVYQPLLEGGKISYSTANERLKIATHQWFDAQLSDHGSHAQEH